MLAVVPGQETSCRHAINTVCDTFQKSDHGIKIALEAEAVSGEFEDSLQDAKYSKNRSPYKASWCEQFHAVLWRSWLSVIKEPILIKVRLLQTVVSAYCNEYHVAVDRRQNWVRFKTCYVYLSFLPDGVSIGRNRLFRSTVRSRRSNEHQWCFVYISD